MSSRSLLKLAAPLVSLAALVAGCSNDDVVLSTEPPPDPTHGAIKLPAVAKANPQAYKKAPVTRGMSSGNPSDYTR